MFHSRRPSVWSKGLALLGTTALTLCVGMPVSSAAPPEDATFTVGFLSNADSLNPFTGTKVTSYELWRLMYATLNYISPTDESVQPALAASWTSGDGGREWTYKLVGGAQWSDGQPVTSKDVVYTLNAVLDGGPEAANWSSALTHVDSVSAPDPATVVLRLKNPSVLLPSIPIPIVPEHVWSKMNAEQVSGFANTPDSPGGVVVSGPFKPVSADATLSSITLDRNTSYYGQRPNIGHLVFRIFKEEDGAVQALKKGDIDFVEGIGGVSVERLKGAKDIATHVGTTSGFNEIAFNSGSIDVKSGDPAGDPNPAVLDPAFRHALGFAIDKRVIIDKAFQGLATPAQAIIPDGSPWQWNPPAQDEYTFDLVKAGRLLDAAGYRLGPNGKRLRPDGSPVGTLRLLARSDAAESIPTMNLFKDWIAKLGLDSSVTPVSSDKLGTIILDGTFDIYEWGWTLDPDPDSMMSYLTCGARGGLSDSWYCDKTYDDMYQAQNSELDHDARKRTLDEMQEKLYLDAPYLLTTYHTVGEAYRSDRFEGFQPQPAGTGPYLTQYNYGYANYTDIRPTAGAASALEQQNGNRLTFILIAAAVGVVAVVAGAVVMRRRRSTADDRE
jgi:peptide/nickel transport system substrate-binding protein